MGSSEAEPKPNRSRHNVASLLCTPETTECRIEARVNESRGDLCHGGRNAELGIVYRRQLFLG